MLKILISRFLSAFMWVTTLIHGGQILWRLLFTATVPDNLRVPPEWGRYLDPSGASLKTFGFYLLVLALSLAWETYQSYNHAPTPWDWLRPFGVGDWAFFLWVGLDGSARIGQANGVFPIVPPYLDMTLVVSLLLFAVQKQVEKNHREGLMVESEPISSLPKYFKTEGALSPPPLGFGFEGTQGVFPVSASREMGRPTVSDRGESNPVRGASNPPLKKRETKSSPPVGNPPGPTLNASPSVSSSGLEQKLMNYLKLNGEAKTGELAGELGVSRRTINRCQDKLVKEGFLERLGKGAGAVCRIKASSQES